MNTLRKENYWKFGKDDGDDKKDPPPIDPPNSGNGGKGIEDE